MSIKPTRFVAVAGTLFALLLVAVAGPALADEVLHEFFILTPSEDSPTGPASGDDPVPDALADAVRSPDLPPPLSIQNRGDEMEVGADGVPISPSGQGLPAHNGPFDNEELARPDRKTTLDHELSYYTVFNPSIVPWKRVSSRDQVHGDYSLGIRDKRVRKVPVADRPVSDGAQRFWGSILIELRRGKRIPIPSVSPNAEILRYQTEPSTYLSFHRDGADNYYVSADYDGTVRINYLMQAPGTYFGGEIDPDLRVEDLDRRRRPVVPPNVALAAQEVASTIGVDTLGSFRTQLNALTIWFRSFEAKDFPEDQLSEDIYRDLALNKLGVCRHRAFAFTVTAQALGILSRYIHNEAHAFVEVYVPKRGWLRVDLGGAAVDFDLRNTNDKVLHSPPEPDSLPKPPGFESSYSHRLGEGQGEADINGDGVGEHIEGTPSETAGPTRTGPADTPQGDAVPPGEEGDTVEDPDLTFPGQPMDVAAPGEETPLLRPTRLKVVTAPRSVFRADAFEVRGRLTTEQGLPLAGKDVEAFLVPKGEYAPETFIRVGAGLTDARGMVDIEVTVPPTVALGPWSLYLFFKGGDTLQHAHSD